MSGKILNGETLIGLNPTEKSQLKPVNWHGHAIIKGRQVDCIVSAEFWFDAREKARQKLEAGEDDVVEVRIELTR